MSFEPIDWEEIEESDDQESSDFLEAAREQDRRPMAPRYEGIGEADGSA